MGVLAVTRTQDELNVVNFSWRTKSLDRTFVSFEPNQHGTGQ